MDPSSQNIGCLLTLDYNLRLKPLVVELERWSYCWLQASVVSFRRFYFLIIKNCHGCWCSLGVSERLRSDHNKGWGIPGISVCVFRVITEPCTALWEVIPVFESCAAALLHKVLGRFMKHRTKTGAFQDHWTILVTHRSWRDAESDPQLSSTGSDGSTPGHGFYNPLHLALLLWLSQTVNWL